ncbi:signal peptidase I [Haploplasma axanthum]|uniref:Signal peptidase I n=1 Tax=Haploplasma axanthum TaxID=29552 RepID=A0A449BD58_HAPAX|nr:signal peptidase I [Haploplasma axanthum]VEU80365.1 signal peptidase I [Haploplasma axanthum]
MSRKNKIIYVSILAFNCLFSLILLIFNVSNNTTSLKTTFLFISILIGLAVLLFVKTESEETIIEESNDEETEKIITEKTKNEFVDWIAFISVVVSVFLIITSFFFFSARVDGTSMEPTIKENKHVYIFTFGYTAKKEDVVVYKRTSDLIIKRVAAVEGDKLSIKEEDSMMYLYINDQLYTNHYGEKYQLRLNDELRKTINSNNNNYVLKKYEVILLGDNESRSSDSRSFGVLSTKRIIGRALGDYSGKE